MWKISLLLSSLALSGTVAAASFDCKKAKTELEHFLCDNAELSQLDSRLGEQYKKLTSSLSPAELKELRATQAAWLDRRVMDCSATSAACLKGLYEKRIDALTFRASPEFKTSAAGKVAGTYNAGKNMFLSVDALNANTIAVTISGAGEGGRWTCDFSAEGELKNGAAKLHVLDDAVVGFRFDKNKVVVSEDASSAYCGMGGALQGTYTRAAH